jgi:hypothetical protein
LARKAEIGEARRPWPSTARALIAASSLVIGQTDQYFATVLDNLLPAFGF